MSDSKLLKKQKELEEEVYRLKVLGEIKRAILVDQSPRRFAEIAFSHLQKIIPFDHADVILFDFEKGKGLILAVAGLPFTGFTQGDTFPLDDCFSELNLILQRNTPLTPELLEPKSFPWMERCFKNLGLGSCISLLLVSHNEVVGILNIGFKGSCQFDQTIVRTARDVADSLAVAIQKALLFEKIHQRASELEALSHLSLRLREAESWEDMVRILLKQTGEAVKADYGFVYWLYGANYRLVGGSLNDPALLTMMNLEDHSYSLFRELLGSDRPVFDNDVLSRVVNQLLGSSFDISESVLLPMKAGNQIIGYLFLGFNSRNDSTSEIDPLLFSIADIAGNALYRAFIVENLEERISSRTKQIEALYDVSRAVNQTQDLGELLTKVTSLLQRMFGCSVFVYLIDEKDFHLKLVSESTTLSLGMPELQSLAERVWKLKGNLHIRWIAQSDPEKCKEYITFLGIPIWGRQCILGVLGLLSSDGVVFGEDDISLFSGVAENISIALENVRLRKQAETVLITEERQRLARELHDSVSQLLYSQLLFARAAQKAHELGHSNMVAPYLGRLSEVAEQAFKEMRLMIYSLRPHLLEDVGLVGALQHRLSTVEKRVGMTTSLETCLDVKLPAVLEDSLFRIAQEALNNTLKHAYATEVSVKLERRENKILLTIKDNGVGFNSETGTMGVGLSSMHERARQLGGNLLVCSIPEKGTTIIAEIPLDEEI